MVFFTAVIIVAILYYLQADGLIYATIIAVIAELINLFMTQTLGKSVEKKMNTKWGKVTEQYKKQIEKNKKTIKELEKIRDEAAQKLYAANKKIEEYEEKMGDLPETAETRETPQAAGNEAPAPNEKTAVPAIPPTAETDPPADNAPETEEFIDLPCGSGRDTGIVRRK